MEEEIYLKSDKVKFKGATAKLNSKKKIKIEECWFFYNLNPLKIRFNINFLWTRDQLKKRGQNYYFIRS